MFVTALLILYFIISIGGVYTSIQYCNKEYTLDPRAYAFAVCVTIFFVISFSIIYLKHIIASVFVIWFIFDTGWALVSAIINKNKTVVKKSTIRCAFNTVCGIISCVGVLYILL